MNNFKLLILSLLGLDSACLQPIKFLVVLVVVAIVGFKLHFL